MQIKSFTARSTKEVLSMIKAELGPDAVILDTQEEDGLISMTAALERAPVNRTPYDAGNGRRAAPFAEQTRQAPFAEQARQASFAEQARQARSGPAQVAVRPEHARPARNAQADAAGAGLAPAASGAAVFFPSSRTSLQDSVPGPASVSPQQARAARAGAAPSPRSASPGPGVTPSPRDHAPRPDVAPSPRDHAPGPAVTPSPQSRARAETRVPEQAGRQQWQEEWSDIKQQLLAIMKPAASLDALSPRQRLAVEFLRREGVEEDALQQLCAGLHRDPSTSILVPLGGLVPICPWNSDNWPQRIQVIAGPFGAGKTTVAVRLALALRKSRPGMRICLLNADAARGNGRLLLRHYCELSDMAYKEASTTPELVVALKQGLREGFDRVIVDLPGLSRGRCLRTLLDDAGLSGPADAGPESPAVHLALSPHYMEIHAVLERYRTAHRSGIVWTKLDEAEHFGRMVNVGAATGLPVSALSFGPGLGNSLAPVKENMLWRLLFKREMPLGA
jgi:flagellar biosynthesis protein FlhF